MANQIKDQKPQTTKQITITACGFSILHLIDLFLATQGYSRNNSSVHAFWISTVMLCSLMPICLTNQSMVNGGVGRGCAGNMKPIQVFKALSRAPRVFNPPLLINMTSSCKAYFKLINTCLTGRRMQLLTDEKGHRIRIRELFFRYIFQIYYFMSFVILIHGFKLLAKYISSNQLTERTTACI